MPAQVKMKLIDPKGGEQLKQGAKSLVGNKGFRRYLKIDRGGGAHR